MPISRALALKPPERATDAKILSARSKSKIQPLHFLQWKVLKNLYYRETRQDLSCLSKDRFDPVGWGDLPMDLGLKGKTALVMASTRGLGFACAKALISEGVRVVVNGRSDDAGRKAQETLGSQAHFVLADTADQKQRSMLFDKAAEHLGTISIVVINGDGPKAEPFAKASIRDWEDAFQSMVLPGIDMIQKCIPSMVACGWGRVISLSSISGKEISLLDSQANGLRPALVGALGTLAREIAPKGVTVNSILSGPFDTPAMRKVVRQHSGRPDLTEDDAVAAYIEAGPMKRVGETKELGALCTFLASEAASYITGQAIAIDGGRVPTLY